MAAPRTASHPIPDDAEEQPAEAEEPVANGRTDVHEVTIPQAQEVCTTPPVPGRCGVRTREISWVQLCEDCIIVP